MMTPEGTHRPPARLSELAAQARDKKANETGASTATGKQEDVADGGHKPKKQPSQMSPKSMSSPTDSSKDDSVPSPRTHFE